jgi:hypothetical protein
MDLPVMAAPAPKWLGPEMSVWIPSASVVPEAPPG